MLIRNITKNRIIGKNVELCSDVVSKSIGLMFTKKQNNTLILKFNKEKIIPLHMFFVFYPIDVLFLDADFDANIVGVVRAVGLYVVGLPRRAHGLGGTTAKPERGNQCECDNKEVLHKNDQLPHISRHSSGFCHRDPGIGPGFRRSARW